MRIKALVLVLPVATFVLLAFSGAASAASFTVLHSFSGLDGETPAAPLVQGADGFFYGVAAHGGDFTVLSPDGGGTAFRMDASGTVTTLHTFRGPEGAWPKSLIRGRDGFFYGTATLGGQPSISTLNPGVGTIFRMEPSGVVTLLYVFRGRRRILLRDNQPGWTVEFGRHLQGRRPRPLRAPPQPLTDVARRGLRAEGRRDSSE